MQSKWTICYWHLIPKPSEPTVKQLAIVQIGHLLAVVLAKLGLLPTPINWPHLLCFLALARSNLKSVAFLAAKQVGGAFF